MCYERAPERKKGGVYRGSSGALPKMRAGPSESALQGQASNHLKLLWSKAVVVSVEAKGKRRAVERVRCGP